MSHHAKIVLFAFAAVVPGMLSAAAQDGAGKQAKVDIRGNITKVSLVDNAGKQSGIIAIVLIEGQRDPAIQYDKAMTKITDKTAIKKLVGKDLKDATLADLKVGCRVESTFTGPVAESYPVQATAKEIIILQDVK